MSITCSTQFTSVGTWLFLLVLFWAIFSSQTSYAQETELPAFTLDFEEGTLEGWQSSGRAFVNQPTYWDQTMSRYRGEESSMEGYYWVSTGTQSYSLAGTLTSTSFTIPEGTLSFIISGSSEFETRVELNILDQIEGSIRVEYATGYDEEVEIVEWDLSEYAGEIGQLRIIDESTTGFIEVDDFIFSYFEETFYYLDQPFAVFNPEVLYEPEYQEQPTVEIYPSNSVVEIGSEVVFETYLESEYDDVSYNFHFGNDDQSGWQESSEMSYVYNESGQFEAYVEVSFGSNEETIFSEPVEVDVMVPEINLILNANKTTALVNESIEFSGGASNESVSMVIYFGDDNATNFDGSIVEHSYPVPGTYTVQLVGYIQQEFVGSQTVTINVGSPNLNLVSGDTFVQTGNTILFSVQLDPARPEFIYEINFEDGNTDTFGVEEQIAHSYNSPGQYQVTASARNPEGDVVLNSNFVEINVIEVNLTSDKEVLKEGESTLFTGSINPEIGEADYTFIIEDSTFNSTTPELEYVFEESGDYEVNFTATFDGRTFFSNPYTVTVQSDLLVSLIAGATFAKAGDLIEFTATGIPTGVFAEYNFHFGDGEESGWTENSTARYSYKENGSYNAFVEARLSEESYIQSSILPLEVGGFPNWIYPVAGGLFILAAGGYLLFKGKLPKSHEGQSQSADKFTTTVTPHTDFGKQSISGKSSLEIKSEIKLKPVKDIGKQTIERAENLLIKEWSHHDDSHQ